jgi:hypothetical protein
MSPITPGIADTWTLAACTRTILDEIAMGLRTKDVALTYAMAILAEAREADAPNWTSINAAIRRRWGDRGLARVKKAAWKLIEAKP